MMKVKEKKTIFLSTRRSIQKRAKENPSVSELNKYQTSANTASELSHLSSLHEKKTLTINSCKISQLKLRMKEMEENQIEAKRKFEDFMRIIKIEVDEKEKKNLFLHSLINSIKKQLEQTIQDTEFLQKNLQIQIESKEKMTRPKDPSTRFSFRPERKRYFEIKLDTLKKERKLKSKSGEFKWI